MSLRTWALALALVGFASAANAGFTGDTVSVSLTAHTSGAIDQVVFNNDSISDGDAMLGNSQPNGVVTPLLWVFSLSGNTFTLSVTNLNTESTTVDPLTLTITGIDSPVTGVSILGPNDFGFVPGDISFTSSTITVSAGAGELAILPGGTELTTTFQVVPEASTLMMVSLAACGVIGGYVVRRCKS